MNRVLVTGATGYLGCNLVRALDNTGIKVTIFRRAASSLKNLQGCQYNDCVGEFKNKNDLRKALEGVDAVFHLAACTSLLDRDRGRRWEANVDHVSSLVEVLLGKKNIRLVYGSSIGAVGFTHSPQLLDEESTFNAHDIHYFFSKKRAEEIVLEGVKQGVDAVIANIGNIIGSLGMRGVQLEALRKVVAGKMFFYPPGGNCFVLVDDVVRGLILAWEKGKTGERYILGGHNLTFREYYKAIADFSNNRPPSIPIPRFILPLAGGLAEILFGRIGKDTGVIASGYGYYSSAKAISQLGYEITSLEQIIKNIHSSI